MIMNRELKDVCRVLVKGGQGEIVEKKSRFIAAVEPVESEVQAAAFIEERKKKYWDARHNCSAFVIGSSYGVTRCSDDGEPAGTAGRPMLELLLGEGLHNTAAVVTRYFGGTLLGTGGLIRAYTKALAEALKNCETGIMRYGNEISLKTDYTNVGRIQHILAMNSIVPLDMNYTDMVEFRLRIPAKSCLDLQNSITEATGGKIIWDKTGEGYYVEKCQSTQ